MDIRRLELRSLNGLTELLVDKQPVHVESFFFSRFLRTDCAIDLPQGAIYSTLFRQKMSAFLEEVIYSFPKAHSFPGKWNDLQKAEAKCAVYKAASSCGLITPPITINSFDRLSGDWYRKALGFPFGISLNRETGEEVAVTLFNGPDQDAPMLGLPWQWQTEIKVKTHIRCVVTGKSIRTYSLDNKLLAGNSLRAAHSEQGVLPWQSDILPSGVRKNLARLVRHLHLHYAAPEFLVDEADNYYFIDLNPCGDWLGFNNVAEGAEIAANIVKRL